MRRLLVLAATLGVLAWVAAPALSLTPYAPRVAEFELSPRMPAAVAAGGPVTLPALRAPKRFDLVGLRWRDARPVEARIRVRRDGGGWSRWLDPGEAESGERGTPPLLTGGADEVQVRLSRRPRGLKLHFVNATGTADRGTRILTAVRRAAHSAVIAAFGTSAVAARRQASGAPAMVTRDQWDPGDQCRPRATPAVGEVKAAIVHHTVTSNLYEQADGPSMVLAICRYHRNSNGWNDIGYNFLVDRYGVIYEGRSGGIDRAVVGAQAMGFNAETTGISNLGTFVSGGQTDAGLAANAKLIAWKLGIHGVPASAEATLTSRGGSQARHPAGRQVTVPTIIGHRDVGQTDCPGGALYAQLPRLRTLTQGAPAGVPLAPAEPIDGAVSLEAPNRTVTYGQAAQVGGRATLPDGTGIGGAEIRVQVQTATRWLTVTKATANADGSWLAQLSSQRTRRVRAVAYRAGVRAGVSPALAIGVAPVIQARAARRVVVKRALAVSGRVRPAKGRLVLEVAREGRDRQYHVVARLPVKVRAGGVFRTVVRLRRPALHRLRVRFGGDRLNAAAVSADVVLRAVRPRGTRGGASAR